MLAIAASTLSVGSLSLKIHSSGSGVMSLHAAAVGAVSIACRRMRLSFVGLCANWRQSILPGARLFELRRQTKQGCLLAEACREHHAERQAGRVPCERH